MSEYTDCPECETLEIHNDDHRYRTDNLFCLTPNCATIDRPGLPTPMKDEWDHWRDDPHTGESVAHCSECNHPKYIDQHLYDRINNPLLLMAQGVNPYGA